MVGRTTPWSPIFKNIALVDDPRPPGAEMKTSCSNLWFSVIDTVRLPITGP